MNRSRLFNFIFVFILLINFSILFFGLKYNFLIPNICFFACCFFYLLNYSQMTVNFFFFSGLFLDLCFDFRLGINAFAYLFCGCIFCFFAKSIFHMSVLSQALIFSILSLINKMLVAFICSIYYDSDINYSFTLSFASDFLVWLFVYSGFNLFNSRYK